MSRTCSHCGNNGHNSRTCSDGSPPETNTIMLFGVRVTPEAASSSFRKSVSMNNLSQYDKLPQDTTADVAAGYESDDVVHASGRCRERKRGVPWTEDEHKLFLLGLQKVGKGDWRGISRNFVKTRTPTQVASHAQKYFLRRTNHGRRRRRSSLFDITPDVFLGPSNEEEQLLIPQETGALPLPPHPKNFGGFPMSSFPVKLGPAVTAGGGGDNSIENMSLGPRASAKLIRPVPIIPVPPSSKMADLNLNPKEETPPLQLKVSTDPDEAAAAASSTQYSAGFQAISGGGDSIISVA